MFKMRFSNTLLFFFLCFLTLHQCFADSSKSCDQKLRKAEQCFKQVLLIDERIEWPGNLNSLGVYNRTMVNSLKCAKQYRPCLKGLPRQIYTLLTHGATKVTKAIFGAQIKPETALNHFKCIGKGTVPLLHKCLDIASKQLEYVSHSTSDKDLFPSMCCVAHTAVNCFQAACEVSCKKKETIDFFSDLFAVLIGDVVDLSCSKQKTLDQCYSNSKQVMDTLNAAAKRELKNVPFIIRPMLKIADKLTQ